MATYTYDFDTSPAIANVRFLVGDTDMTKPVLSDAEVNAALQNESSQNVIIGLSGFSPNPPVRQVYSYRRSAAWLLNGIAANAARAASFISQLLDVHLAPGVAAKTLKDQAQSLIDQESSAGYFAVSEMVQNPFAMRERLDKMLLRQQG